MILKGNVFSQVLNILRILQTNFREFAKVFSISLPKERIPWSLDLLWGDMEH